MKYVLQTILVGLCLGSLLELRAGSSQANALLRDASGCLVVAGLANNANDADGSTDFIFARYLPDGTLDDTFNANGPVPGLLQIAFTDLLSQAEALALGPTDDAVTSLAFDAEGRIIAAGFVAVGLTARIAIIRLNQDGTLDTTFNQANQLGFVPGISLVNISELFDTATGVAVDSQGRIVVVGSSDNGVNLELIVLRLTEDGSLDTSFNAQGATPGILTIFEETGDLAATSLALTQLDDVLIAGTGTTLIGSDFLLTRVTQDGELDLSFNPAGPIPGIVFTDFQGLDDQAFSIAVDANQRIILGGFATLEDRISFALARYNPDGTLDLAFNGSGVQPGTVITPISQNTDIIRGLTVDDTNKIIATGFTDSLVDRSFATVRYNEDGSIDTSFAAPGQIPGRVITAVEQSLPTDNGGSFSEGLAIALGTNNELYIAGFSFDGLQNNVTVINYLENGSLNANFNLDGLVSLQPGIVITPFGQSTSSLGNGVPLIIYDNVSQVNPDILSALAAPLLPMVPQITTRILLPLRPENISIQGLSSRNMTIQLFINNRLEASTLSDDEGRWSFPLPLLADGMYALRVESIDPLTKFSLSSAEVPLTISSHDSQEGTSSNAAVSLPTVRVQSFENTTIISGTSDPDTQVLLAIDSAEQESIKVNAKGMWRIEVSNLSAGTHVVQAQAQSLDGRLSEVSQPVRFSIAKQAVEQRPRITSPASGAYPTSPVTIAGVAAPSSTIRLEINNVLQEPFAADKNGSWTFSFRGSPGNYEMRARGATQNSFSEKIRFFIIPKRANSTSIPSVKAGLIEGMASPASRISLYVDEKLLGETMADSAGRWSFTPDSASLISGLHSVTITQASPQGAVRSVKRTVTF